MYKLESYSEDVMCQLHDSHKIASGCGMHYVNLFWVDPWGVFSHKEAYFPNGLDATLYANSVFEKCVDLCDNTEVAVYVDGRQYKYHKEG